MDSLVDVLVEPEWVDSLVDVLFEPVIPDVRVDVLATVLAGVEALVEVEATVSTTCNVAVP